MSPYGTIMASGTLFDLETPTPAMVKLNDLVHHLSRIDALGGNIQFASYTVAQHALVMVQACTLPAARPYALLLHAPLAYTGAMGSGAMLWHQVQGGDTLRLQRHILMRCILPALGLQPWTDAIARDVDAAHQIANATELRDVVAGRHPEWSSPAKPLASVIRFKPQPKIEDDYRAALDRELRPFNARAFA